MPMAQKDFSYRDRLLRSIETKGTRLCLGIDPPFQNLSPFLQRELERRGPEFYLTTYAHHLIEAGAAHVPAVKIQSAYFEAFGAAGFAALKSTIHLCRQKSLITILDAKRGDISSTMAAYAHMAFVEMGADSLTVTPYMGLDILEPLWPWMHRGLGVYVVWISSNPSGATIQDQVADDLLDALKRAFWKGQCPGGLGLVLGATKVDSVPKTWDASLSDTSLLLPGLGAQGGAMNQRLDQLLGICPTALLPQSRSLAKESEAADNWNEFGLKAADAIKIAGDQVRRP